MAEMAYHFPPFNLLKPSKDQSNFNDINYIQALKEKINATFAAFKMDVSVTDFSNTATSIRMKLRFAPGIKTHAIKNLKSELELAVGNPIEFIFTPALHSFELAIRDYNRHEIVLRDVICSNVFQESRSILTVAAGANLFGSYFAFDLAELNNLLVVGVTGSGKSTFLNDIILSILYKATPEDVQFLMFDGKGGVELNFYNGIPHLINRSKTIITDVDEALKTFLWLKNETALRVNEFKRLKVKNLDSYNAFSSEKKARIVTIVDEYMEMVLSSEFRDQFTEFVEYISKYTAMTGIHLILTTQRPDESVITKEINANIPCRASFYVVDDREADFLHDHVSTERLLGHGDMILTTTRDGQGIHGQAANVTLEEISAVVRFIKDETLHNQKSIDIG